MKFLSEFRDPALARKLVSHIEKTSTKEARLMEFCGTHTMAIFRFGIRQLLPPNVKMASGPGCPVCVTSVRDIDRAIALAHIPDNIITTFGDMIRVPGSQSSLAEARAEGCDVRIVYSARDSLDIALENPDKKVVFLAIGFETTAPTIAAALLESEEREINNFFILPLNKLCPPIMHRLLELGEVGINGILAPGHVSVIIGSLPYSFIPQEFNVACAVSGFEPLDILMAIDRLVGQIEREDYKVEIAYPRGVRPEGNPEALRLMWKVFEPGPGEWRGIGVVEGSGLHLRQEYRNRDIGSIFDIDVKESRENKACLCGDVLRGVKTPEDCKLFAGVCTPAHPVGPCMVSSEGTCAAYYRYSDGGRWIE